MMRNYTPFHSDVDQLALWIAGYSIVITFKRTSMRVIAKKLINYRTSKSNHDTYCENKQGIPIHPFDTLCNHSSARKRFSIEHKFTRQGFI